MKKKQQTSREVRNENRRFQAAIAQFQEEVSDLLKFNQLQVGMILLLIVLYLTTFRRHFFKQRIF